MDFLIDFIAHVRTQSRRPTLPNTHASRGVQRKIVTLRTNARAGSCVALRVRATMQNFPQLIFVCDLTHRLPRSRHSCLWTSVWSRRSGTLCRVGYGFLRTMPPDFRRKPIPTLNRKREQRLMPLLAFHRTSLTFQASSMPASSIEGPEKSSSSLTITSSDARTLPPGPTHVCVHVLATSLIISNTPIANAA